MNDNFTFLNLEQLSGSKQLKVIKIRGTKAKVTDFANLNSGGLLEFYSDYDCNYGAYWTLGICDINVFSNVVNSDGDFDRSPVDELSIGSRPVLKLRDPDYSYLLEHAISIKRAMDGVLEITFGCYPQMAACKTMQLLLEDRYQNDNLHMIANSYTIEVEKNYKKYFSVKLNTCFEYSEMEKRYTRVEVVDKTGNMGVLLSNGQLYHTGDFVWIKVQPVKWLVDEATKLMIAEDILFSGKNVCLVDGCYVFDFARMPIKEFMERYFWSDLTQSDNLTRTLDQSKTRVRRKTF